MYLFAFFLLLQIYGIKSSDLNNGLIKFEKNNGDIIAFRYERSIHTDMPLRWTFPIKYYVDNSINQTMVDEGIRIFEQNTCMSFQKSYDQSRGGLRYIRGDGCRSMVGKVTTDRFQDILLGRDCEDVMTVMHETLHALGVEHEQSRPDRDRYLNIIEQNIIPGLERNFIKDDPAKVTTYDIKYDYGSIMHYHKASFGIDGRDTMIPKQKKYIYNIGQRTTVGFNDMKLINKYYCNNICKRNLNCKYGGYPDPKNCNICRCPDFFTGPTCNDIKKSDASCGQTKFEAKPGKQTFTIDGIKNCFIVITAPIGKSVKLQAKDAVLSGCGTMCYRGEGLEIKYSKDKSLSGAIHCGPFIDVNIKSKDNFIVMRYVGKELYHTITMSYKYV